MIETFGLFIVYVSVMATAGYLVKKILNKLFPPAPTRSTNRVSDGETVTTDMDVELTSQYLLQNSTLATNTIDLEMNPQQNDSLIRLADQPHPLQKQQSLQSIAQENPLKNAKRRRSI